MVRMWVCGRHGPVASKVLADDEIPRCPECNEPLDEVFYGTDGPQGDPRRQMPLRGEVTPL